MKPQATETVLELPLKSVDQSGNVRQVLDADVRELAESVKAQGVLEPVVVTKLDGGEFSHGLVFGFRRARAAKLAGLVSIPAIVRDLKPEQIREAQLVENLQREDLNPVDEAKALEAVLEGTDLTQGELAKRIGKSQPYVANRLRLLQLPEDGQKLVAEGTLSDHVAAEILKLPEDATTERNRLVRQVADRVKRDGEISPREFRWDVQAAQRSYSDRTARAKAVAAAKFPTCPAKGESGEACGKKGRPCSTYDTGANFAENPFKCGAGHRWSSKTGKLYRAEEREAYREPPVPTLPEVDVQVLTQLSQEQVAKRLLDAVKKVASVRLRWVHGTTAYLELQVSLPAAKGAKIPDFEFRDGHKFVELEGASYQRTDADRKKAAAQRADLETWLKTFGRKKKGG